MTIRVPDLPVFVQSGCLLSLNGFLDRDEIKPDIWFRGEYESVNYGGQVMAIPMFALGGALMFFYNLDLFEEAGLDADKPPTTWLEFLDVSKKLVKSSSANELQQAAALTTWSWYFIQWCVTNGTLPISGDGKKSLLILEGSYCLNVNNLSSSQDSAVDRNHGCVSGKAVWGGDRWSKESREPASAISPNSPGVVR
ncbi:MAG: extracellular solute-binding protein [Firmicutes bacterium]|nr:extracellular solute-binding protein [Bacillota bacterium]